MNVGFEVRENMAEVLKRPVLKPSLEQVKEQLAASRTVGDGVFNMNAKEAMPGDVVDFDGNFTVPADAGEGTATIYAKMTTPEGATKVLCGNTLYIGQTPTEITPQIIHDAYSASFYKILSNAWQLADSKYKLPDLAKIQAVLDEDKTEQCAYIAEYYDCDDFTFSLMGAFHLCKNKDTAAMPLFITWVIWEEGSNAYGHSVMSFCNHQKATIIEPQTDTIKEVPANWQLWDLIG